MMGQKLGLMDGDCRAKNCPIQTKGEKLGIDRTILCVLFAICSPNAIAQTGLSMAPKCKVLLYLGNSSSFFVDKPDTLPYDFFISTPVDKLSAGYSSSRVNRWYSPHGLDS